MPDTDPAAMTWAVARSEKVPVAPYMSAMPKSRNAEANAPTTRYFQPASREIPLSRWNALRTYSEIESNSSATKTTSRLSALASTIAPVADHSSRP